MRPAIGDRDLLAARPQRNALDVTRPYGHFVEPERSAAGAIESVATILITNRECPYRCLMCDLWKNTTVESVPAGAVPEQIRWALERLPPAPHVKLYNSGNFSDPQAIPESDYAAIAELLRDRTTVIVENHPRLCGERCLRFQALLGPQLEVAMGLETVDPAVLPHLNKHMTLDDFAHAATFLTDHGIASRTFILLRTPFQSEAEGVTWALRSVDFAFDNGIGCCCIVPTRAGNGIMDRLARHGDFHPPQLASLETVQEQAIGRGRGRVFVDLWDIERLFDCAACGPARKQRLTDMNLQQTILPRVPCAHCG